MLISFFTAQTNEGHSQSALSSPSFSTCSSVSLSPLSTRWITAADWVDDFQIPWTTFPEGLMQWLERWKRPSPDYVEKWSGLLLLKK